MSSALLALTLTLLAQGLPPELRVKDRPPFDPALPDSLRAVVEQASAAELDPKRGYGNALEILRAQRPKVEKNSAELQALDVRVAALVLRQAFMSDAKKPEGMRTIMALSTYSKLDATEPGLARWVERTIAAQPPQMKQGIEKQSDRVVTLESAAQGPGVDADRLHGALVRAIDGAGLSVARPKKGTPAAFIARLQALEVRDQGGRATVRLTLDLAERPAAPPAGTPAGAAATKPWAKTSFRTVEAASAKEAIALAETWLVQVAARDLLFHWLDAHGFEGVILRPIAGDGHDHGAPPPVGGPREPAPGTGPLPGKVTLPKNDGREQRPR